MKILHVIVAYVLAAVRAITPTVPRTPAITRFNENHWARRRYGKVVSGGESRGGFVVAMTRALLGLLTPRTFALAAVILALVLIPDGSVGVLLASPVVLSPEIQKKKADHDKMLGEVLKLQEEYKGRPMPQNVGEEVEAKCQEAEALWAEIKPHIESAEERVKRELEMAERKRRLDALEASGRTVVDPTMPRTAEEKSGGVAGYITFSDYVVMSAEFQHAAKGNFKASAQIAEIPIGLARAAKSNLRGPNGEPLIALTHEERKGIEQRLASMEQKSLVSIGAGVIEPQRLSVVPQVTGDFRPRMRDIIPIGQTTSSSVSYIREESFTRAAAETTPGSAKPEGALSYTEQTATVRTIPAWIPVTTDQLADWPGLRGRIDNRLLYDIAKREAEEIMYGDGSAPNLQGILDVSGTQDITADGSYNASNDVLEHIRLGVALVLTAGYQANGLVIHPMDWFSAVVLKGTDDHYLGQVFMTADREPRVWGLTVVEAAEAEATAGVATEARNLIVGDWMRGCEILDRMQANVMVGLNSDDFTKNRRTLLAEERIAFPIYAPAAFAYKETRASAT